MALIKTVNNMTPKMGQNCFLAENATLVGDVVMGDNCSVWFNAVVRGDVHYIRIGRPVNIGNFVSIAHNAIVHGCTIHDNVLIGMGAIVMDNVVVESHSIIAAGAVVSKNTLVKSGSVWAGVPAKKIKDIDKDLVEGEIKRIAESYTMYAGWYKE
jgi:carbonic anhydrase/acetyltransferase-like protein (isoleucine patch superfamily)